MPVRPDGKVSLPAGQRHSGRRTLTPTDLRDQLTTQAAASTADRPEVAVIVREVLQREGRRGLARSRFPAATRSRAPRRCSSCSRRPRDSPSSRVARSHRRAPPERRRHRRAFRFNYRKAGEGRRPDNFFVRAWRHLRGPIEVVDDSRSFVPRLKSRFCRARRADPVPAPDARVRRLRDGRGVGDLALRSTCQTSYQASALVLVERQISEASVKAWPTRRCREPAADHQTGDPQSSEADRAHRTLQPLSQLRERGATEAVLGSDAAGDIHRST